MNTAFDQIVSKKHIGSNENPISMNDVIRMAQSETLEPAIRNPNKSMFLGIDMQHAFMDHGDLGVAGAIEDTGRACRFIYDHIEELSNITVSLDTHSPFSIFFANWWRDQNGNRPNPYTEITLNDYDNGVWIPERYPKQSRDYIENLERLGRKKLCIWPYHGIQGTTSAVLENQFANIVYFFSVSRKSKVDVIVKGMNAISEMYGILRPEYSESNYVNIELLDKFKQYEKIFIAGQAKSHCVYESVLQIVEHLKDIGEEGLVKKIYILEDCMSSIQGFEKETDLAFGNFKKTLKMNIVKSTDRIF